MKVDDNYVINIVKKGLNNITTAELIHAYKFVTGEELRGSCGNCVKRKGWNKIYEYYNNLIKTTIKND